MVLVLLWFGLGVWFGFGLYSLKVLFGKLPLGGFGKLICHGLSWFGWISNWFSVMFPWFATLLQILRSADAITSRRSLPWISLNFRISHELIPSQKPSPSSRLHARARLRQPAVDDLAQRPLRQMSDAHGAHALGFHLEPLLGNGRWSEVNRAGLRPTPMVLQKPM